MPTFVESDHPRREDGKFGSGSGASKGKKLSSTEDYAIAHYVLPSDSATGFLKLNQAMREGDHLSSEQLKQVERLDSAIEKLPKFEGRTFRGVRFKSKWDEASFLEANIEGSEVSFPSYLSTSKNSAVATGSVRIVIEGTSGADLTGISEDKSEQEVLYPRNTKFKITRIAKDSHGGTIIGMRQISDGIAMDSASMRTYTADGRMHIARSHISKACVNPYYGKEIPGADKLGLDPNKTYYMLRDPEELARAVDTFKILPILNKHITVTDFDGMDEQAKKKYIVGGVGSDVEFLYPFLDADTCIWEANAIVGIETDKVREFSCSYRYVPVMTTGTYKGVHYDGIMTQIQGNHLALVESGRAGNEVLAADNNLEIISMKTKLGQALETAISVAFPKVIIANDSELGKLFAGATRKNFDVPQRKKALGLILAMDAEIDGKQVNAVMDALADVDDPKPTKKDNDEEEPAKDADEHPKGCICADCKTARDSDDDDADEKKRKAAKDKAAKDKAKDAASKDDVKSAMDELTVNLRKEFADIEEAKRTVRPTVGDVLAADSAEGVYDFALKTLAVDTTDVTGLPAKKALYKLATDKKPSASATFAMDSVETVKRFPGLARIRQS